MHADAIKSHIRKQLDKLTGKQTMTNKARLGSISTGTLRTVDLIDAFAGELEYLSGETPLTLEAYEWLTIGAEIRSDITPEETQAHEELGNHILAELFDALDELAPPYCHFGVHWGDGADFGFWPSWDAIEELPCISDPGADRPNEDHRFVNDHGNVTVYGADASILLEIV